MADTFGWVGKMALIDLTSKSCELLATTDYKKFIGGKGINQYLLLKNVSPGVDAHSPENMLLIGAGPLVGTLAPAGCRTSIDTINALTGGTASANCGGFFASELKYAGFDHLLIVGKASKPVYLFIHDGMVEFRDAKPLRGLSTWETESYIRSELNDVKVRVLSIGPAGENLLSTACIITENGRAAAKGGTGSVMGSKNLKAIAARGCGPIHVKDPDYLTRILTYHRQLKGPGITALQTGGTHNAYFESSNNASSMPVRNNQEEYWAPEKLLKVRQDTINALGYEKLRFSCHACPIYCSHFYDTGNFRCEGFEATNAMGLGAKLDITDPAGIIRLTGLCNAWGIDTDCVGTEIAWAMELFQRGIISEADTDGLSLEWGNVASAETLLSMIVEKRGFGEIFSDGVKVASERLGRGSDYYAAHTKGEDLYESIRAQKGWALGISVAPKGGGHCEGAPVTEGMGLSSEKSQELFGIRTAGMPLVYEDKAKLIRWHEAYSAAINALGMCYYTSFWGCLDAFSPDDYAELYEMTTGEALSGDEFMETGLRIHNVEKAFNTIHRGFTKKDDYPPRRYFEESLNDGPRKGERLDAQEWSDALSHYYELHGWNTDTGWQKREVLESLELHDVADLLASHGKLSK